MAYLPTTETAALATRSDVSVVAARIEDVRTELKSEIQLVRTELKSEIQLVGTEIRTVNQRIDRLFLTLGAGMLAMLVAVFTEFIVS
ncbi:MAG: hypothetical protein ABWY62_00110 [Acidimicrobiia bacterium]